MAVTHVEVELRIGTDTFTRSTADVFSRDTLTVSAIDDERVLQTYLPGEWRSATVFDAQGYPLHLFTSSTPTSRAQTDLHALEMDLT